MSIIYEAALNPTKAELLSSWLPEQEWFTGNAATIQIVSGYRFDDPQGEVGIQGQIVATEDGSTYHVPLTYRGAPLANAEGYLIGTMEHSVLGDRWVYDAIGDPVFQQELARVIATGGTEAEEFTVAADGLKQPREVQSRVKGSGSPLVTVPQLHAAQVGTEDGVSSARASGASLSVLRRVDPHVSFSGNVETLTATWETQKRPVVLATLERNNA